MGRWAGEHRETGENYMADLIADIGMHDGQDTDFYLKKGYRVVAVEANPELVEAGRQRFTHEIESGRLTIIHAAIGASAGTVKLFVNDRKTDWSSIHEHIAGRDGKELRCLEVPSMSASDFFDRYGEELFYAKIDIEGEDVNVLLGLMNSTAKPKYLSIEATAVWHLGIMRAMGYNRFKLINQAYWFDWTTPCPAIHGESIDYRFHIGSSGPFGEETQDEWHDVDRVADSFVSIQRLGSFIPRQTMHSWWDFHASR